MTADDKARIVATLNARYGTSVTVHLVEIAVSVGMTSWPALQREAGEIPD